VKPLDQDYFFMAQAIAIAKKGQGKTHPNPCVGALVIHNGLIVGEGFHEKLGSAHAEVIAAREVAKLERAVGSADQPGHNVAEVFH
jgi:diaminohydroxyphosphoribosylaminopyrimidine deaminase/5-amino-6-(5-phosphoribosylamino)uracil reductase